MTLIVLGMLGTAVGLGLLGADFTDEMVMCQPCIGS